MLISAVLRTVKPMASVALKTVVIGRFSTEFYHADVGRDPKKRVEKFDTLQIDRIDQGWCR
jgi:hypothetical protein